MRWSWPRRQRVSPVVAAPWGASSFATISASKKSLYAAEQQRADVAGLRHDRMVAPFVLEGPMNGLTFVEYVKQCLVPTLRRRDVVIMDNLASHKVPGVREAIESVGARLRYLPQYSPDLNPIEPSFSKVKAHRRKAAERTVNGLCRRIGKIARSFRTQECANF